MAIYDSVEGFRNAVHGFKHTGFRFQKKGGHVDWKTIGKLEYISHIFYWVKSYGNSYTTRVKLYLYMNLTSMTSNITTGSVSTFILRVVNDALSRPYFSCYLQRVILLDRVP